MIRLGALALLLALSGCARHLCLDPVHPSPDCAAVWR